MRVITLPGVFKPRSDSWLLADLLAEHVRPGASVLDLCTGSGVLAVAAARAGAGDVTGVDVSRRATWTARINGRLNRVRVNGACGNLFDAVRGRRFDLIVSNPPYLPARTDELPERGPARAWDAGRDGRGVLDRILERARDHLRPAGALLVVHSSVCGESATIAAMQRSGLAAETIVRLRGPLGPLLGERAHLLEARGLLAPGSMEEELLFILGRAPAPAAQSGAAAPATITPYRDGPYIVTGPFVMRDQDGNVIDVQRRTIALCRCGRSKLRPFCDGTHKVAGFKADSAPERQPAVPAEPGEPHDWLAGQ